MAFSEKTKLKVKKKAMFRCCRCYSIGVDVHHIIPQKDKGPDDISNAAPLCQNCHDQFGDNPQKRKEITQMRDHWYETVEKMYSPQAAKSLTPLIEKMSRSLDELKKSDTKKDNDLEEIKGILRSISNEAIDKITPGNIDITASNLVQASGASLSNYTVEELTVLKFCTECGIFVSVGYSHTACPYCGAFLNEPEKLK